MDSSHLNCFSFLFMERSGWLSMNLFKKKKIALNPVCFPPMATAKTDMLTRTCNVVYFRWGASD